LSVYEKAVLDLLKEGPKQRKWIVGQLCPRIMSQKKAQKTLNELENAGKVKAVSKRIGGESQVVNVVCFARARVPFGH
jgi:hypothetical protein